MGTRTGSRGNDPAFYSDDGLAAETARVRMSLRILAPSKASLRKSLESRLHNLETEERRRGQA